MIDKIIQYNGFNIALAGITIVFGGLILIAFTIHVFNIFFTRESSTKSQKETSTVKTLINTMTPSIPEDELVAIAAAIECYRRIHFDDIPSQITYKKGKTQNTWRTGTHFGQRISR